MNEFKIEKTDVSNGRARVKVLELRDRTMYGVDYLDNKYHPMTAYSKGEQLYFGDDLRRALSIIRRVFGHRVVIPEPLKRLEEEANKKSE